MHQRMLSLMALLALSSCGGATDSLALPTAHILARAAPSPFPTVAVIPTLPSTPAPTLAPWAPSSSAPLDQYRVWIEEARALHPYGESSEMMWALMICESSGKPDAVGSGTSGLFQYTDATWAGAWNPYRDQPIFDPRAQIFATAKAWQDGNQVWWTCYGL